MTTRRYFRKIAMLAKNEASYGDDAAPTGSANAILAANLNIHPLEATEIERDLYKPHLGANGKILAGLNVQIDFEVELAGAGAAGTAPGYGPLLKACALAETITAATVEATIAETAEDVDTPTGDFTYTRTTAFAGTRDRAVTLTCTNAGGSGVAEFTVNAPATADDAEYNETGVVMTDSAAFALPNGAEITPTVGTSFDLGDAFTIALSRPGAAYAPVSEAAEMASLTLYFQQDGIRHIITGARGSVKITGSSSAYPKLVFNFTGLYADPTDTALPTVDTAAFQVPLPLSQANTPVFSLHGVSAPVESLEIDLANSVETRILINTESIETTGRAASGQVVIEQPLLAELDLYALAKARIRGALAITHGTTPGNIIEISAPLVELGTPSLADSQGIITAAVPLSLVPSDAGNDEIVITIR